jgi:hypothetical protein
LTIQYDEPLSVFAFNFNLRRYNQVEALQATVHVLEEAGGVCGAVCDKLAAVTECYRAADAALVALGSQLRAAGRRQGLTLVTFQLN